MVKHYLLPIESIQDNILLLHNQKVLLGTDLARLYGVETKVLMQAVKRNIRRFPSDFMFQLNAEETGFVQEHILCSRSQFVTLKRGFNVKYRPYAFTEQGVAMLSSVLKSERAIEVNIAIMRAFVRLRELLLTHKELAGKLKELEEKVGQHDEKIIMVFEAIRQLMESPEKPKREIGFRVKEPAAKYSTKRKK
ncbi:MAG: ORF6N domain-containing protein [Bacteroidota bacterium]